jgi:hypothetical protein
MTADTFGAAQIPPPASTEPKEATDTTTDTTGSDAMSEGHSPKGTAKEQASDVAREGVQAGKHVASVATDQAQEVAAEAGHQTKALLGQARAELKEQAATQQNRVAEQLHALSKELGSMASKSEQPGLAADLAGQASRQLGSAAHWVSEREPGSLVTELKDFARNKPGTFLAVAAGIGLVAGRMTRGFKAGTPGDDGQSSRPLTPAWGTTSPIRAGMTTPHSPSASEVPTPSSSLDDGLPGLSPPNPAAGVGAYPEDAVIGEPLQPRRPGVTS